MDVLAAQRDLGRCLTTVASDDPAAYVRAHYSARPVVVIEQSRVLEPTKFDSVVRAHRRGADVEHVPVIRYDRGPLQASEAIRAALMLAVEHIDPVMVADGDLVPTATPPRYVFAEEATLRSLLASELGPRVEERGVGIPPTVWMGIAEQVLAAQRAGVACTWTPITLDLPSGEVLVARDKVGHALVATDQPGACAIVIDPASLAHRVVDFGAQREAPTTPIVSREDVEVAVRVARMEIERGLRRAGAKESTALEAVRQLAAPLALYEGVPTDEICTHALELRRLAFVPPDGDGEWSAAVVQRAGLLAAALWADRLRGVCITCGGGPEGWLPDEAEDEYDAA